MTIGRRQMFGLGALGLGVVAADGCGGLLPWGRAPTMSGGDVDRLLAELDDVVLHLDGLEVAPETFGVHARGRRVDEGRATSLRLLKTLCFMGTYRDVPQSMWSEPRVEARLAKTLPQIHATITSARDRLAAITTEQAAKIDERLQKDPELTMRIMERVDDYARQIHVPIEQRTYLRTATVELAGRFRFQGTKEVTSKLTSKYDRASAARMNELGIPPDGHPAGDADAAFGNAGVASDAGGSSADDAGAAAAGLEQSVPLRARFHTSASLHDVQVASCALDAQVTLDDAARPIVVDWEEFRCPLSSPLPLRDDAPPIHATVHTEPGEDGRNLVTVVLYPPTGAISATDDAALTAALTSLAKDLQRRLTPMAKTPPPVVPRLGSVGESCRTKADCDDTLVCTEATCHAEEVERASSAKLIRTTKEVAKWGAYLSIPPICAIGVLVLLTCLFMVIVAGCMYAGGD